MGKYLKRFCFCEVAISFFFLLATREEIPVTRSCEHATFKVIIQLFKLPTSCKNILLATFRTCEGIEFLIVEMLWMRQLIFTAEVLVECSYICLWYCVCITVVVNFRPPRDQATCPSSTKQVSDTWQLPEHPSGSPRSSQTSSGSCGSDEEIESVVWIPIFKLNLHLNLAVTVRRRINHIYNWTRTTNPTSSNAVV